MSTDDMDHPTPALNAAVNSALYAERSVRSAEQQELLRRYFDATCGDCENGRCHGSGPCGCARHEVSARWGVLAVKEGGPR
jgi:hypothetical protein